MGLVVMFHLAGVVAVLVGIPTGVHTVGRLTAKWVERRSPLRASPAHLLVGLGIGGLVAAMMISLAQMEPVVAVIAFVVPVGLLALGTNLLMLPAERRSWVRIIAWVLGAVPALAGITRVAAWGLRGASWPG